MIQSGKKSCTTVLFPPSVQRDMEWMEGIIWLLRP